MNINVVLDSSIHLNPNNLSSSVKDEILSRLRVPNPQKKIAEKEMLWNAKSLPSYIDLWKYNSHHELVLPRGFIFEFEKILKGNDTEICWDDKTTFDPKYLMGDDEISLRDYQLDAVSELCHFKNGIYKASTGSGKTIVMLVVARECHQKTLVICEKNDIAVQWENTANKLGFNVGKDLIVGLRQGIWSAKYDQAWFDQFGMLIYDETHHASAETVFELIQRFPARYRFGCSATPDSDQDLFPIARAVIGPVVSESTVEEIGEHLVIPSVRVVKTEFEFPYRPTQRQGKKVIRNNYNGMLIELEEDSYRNAIITNYIAKEFVDDHSCLVVSKRKNHLNELLRSLNQVLPSFMHYPTYVLTGDNSDEYDIIKNNVESHSASITFSTLADEGTDVPIWDRLFLVYPGRKLRGFEQAIGRIMRPHPEKKDAIVYDFRDYRVSLLNSQFRERSQMIYAKKKYKVETLDA